MKNKKNIVFISISSDMYGSSKVLLSLVLSLKEKSSEYTPIVCMPLEKGPLKDILISEDIHVIEMPVVKLTRSMLKSFGFISLAKEYFKAKRIFKNETSNIDIACIQSNTLATMFGALFCLFGNTKHIVHVHEIIDRPKAAQFFFKNMLRFLADKVVYNSLATERFYNTICPSLKKKSVTIVNGVDKNENSLSEFDLKNKRKQLFNANDTDILIGLVGRINRLKGHTILVEAFKEIQAKLPNTKLCFVGSTPPNQEFYLSNLKENITQLQLEKNVNFLNFQDEIFPVLESLDIIAVPSTEPESFGLIVVEAMLAEKAVVASKIGGISTIIENEKTGFLFEPNNKQDLVNTLLKVLENPLLRKEVEKNAQKAAEDNFSINKMYENFIDFYYETL